QTYDIIFTAPRFAEDGVLRKPAFVTVLHNGVLVQNHTEILGDTPYDRVPKYTKHADKLPIVLMYHGDPVRFRNIWIREFKELEGKAGGKKGRRNKEGFCPARGKAPLPGRRGHWGDGLGGAGMDKGRGGGAGTLTGGPA